MVSAREICNRRVVIAKAGEGSSDVANRMLEEGVDCVVVVEANGLGRLEPKGIITDRDVIAGVLTSADRQLGSLTVGDVMSRDLVTAAGSEPLDTVFKRMSERGVRRIVIVDDDGSLEGIISLDEWVDYLDAQLHALSSLLECESERESEWHERRRRLSPRPEPRRAAPGLRLVFSSRARVRECARSEYEANEQEP